MPAGGQPLSTPNRLSGPSLTAITSVASPAPNRQGCGARHISPRFFKPGALVRRRFFKLGALPALGATGVPPVRIRYTPRNGLQALPRSRFGATLGVTLNLDSRQGRSAPPAGTPASATQVKGLSLQRLKRTQRIRHKIPHLHRILLPRRRFHPTRHIHGRRPHNANRLRNIIRREPPRQDEWHFTKPSLVISESHPRHRLARAAITSWRHGIYQHRIGPSSSRSACIQVSGDRADPAIIESPRTNQRSELCLRNQLNGFISVQLNCRQLRCGIDALNLLERVIHEHARN